MSDGMRLGGCSISLAVADLVTSRQTRGHRPAHIVFADPDGSVVMVDQFVDRPSA